MNPSGSSNVISGVSAPGGPGGRWSAAGLKNGRHVRYPDNTPVTNLWMTLLDKMGVPAERVWDSTGHVKHLWNI